MPSREYSTGATRTSVRDGPLGIKSLLTSCAALESWTFPNLGFLICKLGSKLLLSQKVAVGIKWHKTSEKFNPTYGKCSEELSRFISPTSTLKGQLRFCCHHPREGAHVSFTDDAPFDQGWCLTSLSCSVFAERLWAPVSLFSQNVKQLYNSMWTTYVQDMNFICFRNEYAMLVS